MVCATDSLDSPRRHLLLWWGPWVRLRYTITSTDEAVDYRIDLQTTRPHFGGLRWWFTCPLVRADRPCRRRCEKLYLAPGGTYYGCRKCYVSYACQREDRADRMLRKANKIRFATRLKASAASPTCASASSRVVGSTCCVARARLRIAF